MSGTNSLPILRQTAQPVAEDSPVPSSPGSYKEDHIGERSQDYLESFEELSDEDKRAERFLLWRLDLVFLTYGFIASVFKSLDQSNISNAYVSGMKEDLKLYGNQLNYFTTYFNIGYILMLYPSITILSHVGPQRWLPSMEIIWGILTCFLSIVKSYKQVYWLRAFIGFAEGSAWPGFYTLLSAFYTPEEIALRGAIYGASGQVAAMFSGVLQAALYTNLNGVGGRAGWRWLFIVNGVCTVAVGIAGYFCFPGFPDRPNPLAKWYLSDASFVAARRRVARLNRQNPEPLTFKRFGRVFLRWELWVLGVLCWDVNTTGYASGFFNLWLKSLKKADGKTALYTVAQLNYIPIAGAGLQLVWTVIIARFSDWTGRRTPFLIINSLVAIFAASILVVRPHDRALYWAGWLLSYLSGQGFYILWAWIADVCAYSSDLRTVIYATGTTTSYILSATIPPHAFQSSLAPNWPVGPKITIGAFSAGIFIFLGTARLIEKQRVKQKGWRDGTIPIPEQKGFFPVQGLA